MGMELTRKTVARLAREVVGLELSDADLERLLPYMRAQLASVGRLEALAATLGLEGDDPRAYTYAEDRRWLETASAPPTPNPGGRGRPPRPPQCWGECEAGRRRRGWASGW